jgi:hypothetical protein
MLSFKAGRPAPQLAFVVGLPDPLELPPQLASAGGVQRRVCRLPAAGCDGSLGGAPGEAARIGHEMWDSWGEFCSRDGARSTRERQGRTGHNVASGRKPQMPPFGENDPSSEIPRLAYCDTARPRRRGVPHPKARVRTHSRRHRQCPLAPRLLRPPACSVHLLPRGEGQKSKW